MHVEDAQEMSRRERRMHRKRAEIVQIAARLFTTIGYEQTTLEMIAEELYLTPTSLYYYVNSKEDLLLQILRDMLLDFEERILAVIAEPLPADERLHRLILTHIVSVCERPESRLLDLFYAGYFLTKDRPELLALSRRYQQHVEQIIVEGIEQGLFHAESGVATSTILGAMNMISRWYSPDGPFSPLQIGAYNARLLIGGLMQPYGLPMQETMEGPTSREA